MNRKTNSRDAAIKGWAFLALLMACWLISPSAAGAGSHPSAHAPIGVMADHTHAKGEVMFSYRYMRMAMDGLRDDDERISGNRVLEDFLVTPTSMDMEMHMFGAMFAPIERLTLMLMVPYVVLEMDHRTRMGARFTTKSEGIGDIRVAGLIDLFHQGGHKVHAQVGVSFPSGTITNNDQNPMSNPASARLPYPMQIGSGTFDFLPGLTYTGHLGAISWGAQATGEIRMNENHAQYQLGNEYELTAWGGYEWAKWVSTSLRLEWSHGLNINGRDVNLNPSVVPTADPGRRATQRLDVLAGVNFLMPEGLLSGVRIAVEAGLPAYQRLDGPALETDWVTTVGMQYAFE